MPHAAARHRSDPERTTLYQDITARIIAELEAGRLPWVQPWGSSAVQADLAMPRNAATGRGYSGINILILWGAVVRHGFASQSWFTFRQGAEPGRSRPQGRTGRDRGLRPSLHSGGGTQPRHGARR